MQHLRDHPLVVTCLLAAVGSILGLRPIPASIPLISLLVIIRISTQLIVSRPHALRRLFSLWMSITIGCIISFASAGSTAVASISPTLVYSLSFSLLGLSPFAIAAKFRLNGFFFPAVWSTWWGLITAESPIGRLGIWAPLAGDGAYAWTRPYLGELGIDWVIGAWTEVLSSFVTWHLIGGPAQRDEEELQNGDSHNLTEQDPLLPAATRQTSGSIWTKYQISILAGTLIGLSLPASFINTLPTPLYDDNLRQIGVACVLPKPNNAINPFDLFIRETLTVTNRAHVVLWPEGAVYFDSEADREQKLEWVRKNATHNGATIGVSFTEPIPGNDSKNKGKRRNGIAVINKDGVLMEYYKRHLVPLVESFPQVPGNSPSPVINITEGSSKKASQQWQLTLSANICLDFAHPAHDLPVKPTLILGPARTWHTNVGQVMMEMARHRAEELGTRVLWCDGGEGGLSGVVGMGESEVQVGYGSWIKEISVRVPLDQKPTPFGRNIGEPLGLLISWVAFFLTSPFALQRLQVSHWPLLTAATTWVSQRVTHQQPHQNLIDV